MALKIKLYKMKHGDDGTTVDTYYGEDGAWTFYVHLPKDYRPTTADIHFEFEDDEEIQQ